ncbi:MAG: pentapeptide repeat-containing protein [Planctomycetota bacterium]
MSFSTIKCGKHLAEHTNLAGSRFNSVNLESAEFRNVNLANASFHNLNLSGILISAAQLGGALFRHVGLPTGSPGKQSPVTFEECDLNGSRFDHCDLTNASITDCDVAGLTINGIPVEQLMSAWSAHQSVLTPGMEHS